MGNKNSICPAEKYLESIECPICLDETSKYLTLNCGHKFDHYCIQMCVFTNYSNNLEVKCPYCRNSIDKKTMSKIWKNWVIVNYTCDMFSKNTIVNIDNNLKISKLNEIGFNTEVSDNTILMPLFFGKPVFLLSPVVNDSNILHNDKVIELSKFFDFYNTDYGEKIEKYKYVFDCYITDKKWNKFLLKNKKIFEIENDNKIDFVEKCEYSDYKIRFYINDTNKVKTLDNYNGRYDNKLHYFKNRKFKCLFKMYFIHNKSDFFLINELHSIIYD